MECTRPERPLMTRTRGRVRWLGGAVLVLVLVGCGTGGPVSPAPPATPAPTGASSVRPTEPALQTGPTTATSARATPPSAPAPRNWTGKFHGHRVTIPYGHGAPVSFTFDDGPSAEYTPQVLALLKQHHVPAVFCLIGTQARTYPALVRREARAGHQLCDHSRDHDLNMNSKGKAYVFAEVDDGLADIRDAHPGVPVRFYRQPGGFWSPTVVKAMNRRDLYPLRWSDDPKDWSRPGSATIVHRVVKHLHPGAVILMHDGGGDRSETVEALTWLLQALPAAGWTPVPAPRKRLSSKAAAEPQ